MEKDFLNLRGEQLIKNERLDAYKTLSDYLENFLETESEADGQVLFDFLQNCCPLEGDNAGKSHEWMEVQDDHIFRLIRGLIFTRDMSRLETWLFETKQEILSMQKIHPDMIVDRGTISTFLESDRVKAVVGMN